jgi:hypothetical protein
MKSVRDSIHNKVSKQILFKIYHQTHYPAWKRLHLMYSLETHQQIRDNLRIQIHNQSYEIGIWSNI